jgi:hypothetical protein
VSLTALLLALVLVVVMLLVGGGVLALLLFRPAWCAPMASALAAMTLMAAVVGLLVAAAQT